MFAKSAQSTDDAKGWQLIKELIDELKLKQKKQKGIFHELEGIEITTVISFKKSYKVINKNTCNVGRKKKKESQPQDKEEV